MGSLLVRSSKHNLLTKELHYATYDNHWLSHTISFEIFITLIKIKAKCGTAIKNCLDYSQLLKIIS